MKLKMFTRNEPLLLCTTLALKIYLQTPFKSNLLQNILLVFVISSCWLIEVRYQAKSFDKLKVSVHMRVIELIHVLVHICLHRYIHVNYGASVEINRSANEFKQNTVFNIY